jgi:pectate lyase
VTYHHNYFLFLISQTPSISNGASAHVYSNCFDVVEDYGLTVSHSASALVEGNAFIATNQAIITNMDPENEGSVTERNNEFFESPISVTQTGHEDPSYDYT